ncbi:MAG: alpha/beta hydrolase, partial [Acidimicrobiia bacterium]|nr:alpha/beta hydrolase [Acidimicrobiia bacterium]
MPQRQLFQPPLPRPPQSESAHPRSLRRRCRPRPRRSQPPPRQPERPPRPPEKQPLLRQSGESRSVMPLAVPQIP